MMTTKTQYPVIHNCNFGRRTDECGSLVWQGVRLADSGRLDANDRDERHLLDCLESLEETLATLAEEMDAASGDACRAAEEAVAKALRETRVWVLDAFTGARLDAPATVEAMERCDWTGYYPVIDAHMRLTGEFMYADQPDDSMASYGDEAVIDRDDAVAAGWTVDDDGYAKPPEAVARLESRPVEGTGWYVYVGGVEAGGPFETEADALENWRE